MQPGLRGLHTDRVCFLAVVARASMDFSLQ